MSKFLPPYFTILIVMVVLDMVWLGGVAKPIYQRGIGHLMAARPNFIVAVAFYLLYAAGAMVFVVLPQAAADWKAAFAWGALFGFLNYMTYDLTNLATLREWPVTLSFVDTAWGTLATGVAVAAGKLVAERFA